MNMSLSVLLAAAAVVVPVALCGQQPRTATLLGRIIDQTDTAAVAHATVNVLGTNLVGYTDGWGYFRISGIVPGDREIVVRALGYAKLTESQTFANGEQLKRDFSMMRLPHTLTQMVILGHSMRVPHGMEAIYRRGMRGWGKFITREQIDSINPVDLKMMLGMLPGVFENDHGVTFPTCGNPHIWVDGQDMTRFEGSYAQAEFLSYLIPSEVQAVEVYTRPLTVPAEFLGGNPCGVVAIWLKRGP